jgi:hypothetical protein
MINNYSIAVKVVKRTMMGLLTAVFSFGAFTSDAQVRVPFTTRTTPATIKLKGDFAMTGNSNLRLVNYSDEGTNSANMRYIDIDSDLSTFNSSSATLEFSSENGASAECSEIIYAGLYWSGRASDAASSPNTFTVTKSMPTAATQSVNQNSTVINEQTITNSTYTLVVTRGGSSGNYHATYTFYNNTDSYVFQFTNNTGASRVTVSVNGGAATNVPVTYNNNNNTGTATLTTPYQITDGAAILRINTLVRDSRVDRSESQTQSAASATVNLNGTVPVYANVTKTFDKTKVLFKAPGMANYVQKTVADGDIYYPENGDGFMYSAFVDVTSDVQQYGDGSYTIADVALVEGNGGGTGYYGGWGMVVIYENYLMNWRDITIFDGHSYVAGGVTADFTIPVSGFQTAPAGDIDLKIGMMAGEGDRGISGDFFEIRNAADNAWVRLNHGGNSQNNYFNSSIFTGGNTRNPTLLNNSGMDVSTYTIDNPGNAVVANGQTATTFRYGTTQDTYIIYNITMSVNSYVPEVEGLVSVININGSSTLPSPLSAGPGEEIEYEVEIRNLGTEPVDNFIITIPMPYTGTLDVGSLNSSIFFAPNPAPNNLYYDANIGPNGSIVYDFGTLPLPTNPQDLLASFRFTIRATDNCALLNEPSCLNEIPLTGTISGEGAITGFSVLNAQLITGYESVGACVGEPIYDPIVTIIDVDPQFLLDNCTADELAGNFKFCPGTPTIPVSSVASSYPAGTRFFNEFPVNLGTSTEYTTTFPALAGSVITYYAVPPTVDNGCVMDVHITICSAIDAVNDAGGPVNGGSGGTDVVNVFDNDLLNGVAVNPALVTLTEVTPDPTGALTLNPDGSVDVAPGTAAGSYTLTYRICENLFPANCDDAIVTVTVVAPVIDAVDDSGTASGFTGGTAVPNVWTNDLLNGAPVVPAQLTTTVVTPASNPGVVLNTGTGAVTVTAGTPAGIYTIIYRICENLNPTNCDNATITVTVTAPLIDAVNDNGTANGFTGGTAISTVWNNDLLNGVAVNPALITTTVVTPASNPGVVLNPATGVVTVAAGTPAATYTITYRICENLNPTNCDNAIATVVVTAPAIVATDDNGGPVNGGTGQTGVVNVFDNDLLNGSPVVPSAVTLSLVTPDPEGALTLNPNGSVDVAPGTPSGVYTLTYRICENLNPTNCDQALVTISVGVSSIVAIDDNGSANGFTGGTAVPSIWTNDLLNGVAVDPSLITTTVVSPSSNPGVVLNTVSGAVTVAAGTAAGTYFITYRNCENLNPTNCDDALVTVVVNAPAIDAVDDSGTANSYTGGTAVANVWTNDLLNGSAVNSSLITTTVVTPASNPGVVLNPGTGAVTVAAGTPAAVYTITYRICENLNPTNCDNAVVTVTVTAPVIDAVNDNGTANGFTGGTPVANVWTNDQLNGAPVIPSQITTTVVTPASNGGVVLNTGTGAVTVASGTPAATYTIVYRICENVNPTNCDNATVTILVNAPAILAVDDNAGPINGLTGATGVVNVFTNDQLNGSPVVPSAVTLTQITPDPTGSLTLNPNGTVDVDANTPAGVYTLTYQICENLNPTNCDQALVTVTVVAAPIIANNDNAGPVNGLVGETDVLNVFDNDLLNGSPVVPAEVTLTEVTPDPTGSLTLNPDGSVDVVPGTPAGTYTLTYQICENLNPTNCDQATASVTVDLALIVANDDNAGPINGLVGATNVLNVFTNDQLNGVAVNPADVTLTEVTPDPTGALTLNPNGSVDVDPNTPAGSYSLTYQICENLNPTNCDPAVVTVTVVGAPIVANDDSGTANGFTGGTPVANVWVNDLLNGVAVVPSQITTTVVTPASNVGVVLNTGTGAVTVAAGTPAGIYTIVYNICENLNPTNCDPATVTVTVTSPVIDAVNDNGTANGFVGGTAVPNVWANDLLNGAAVNPALITTTVVTPASNSGVVLNPATGVVTVAAGTPASVYTITYRICENLNPTNCDDAVVTITVTAPAIDAVDDSGTANSFTGGTAVANVWANDLLNGVAVNPTLITTTVVTPASNPGVVLNPATGVVTVAAGVPAAVYTITYRICENLNPTNCDNAIVTVTVTAPAIDAVDDSGTASGFTGGTAVQNVWANDLLNGSPVNPALITTTVVTPSSNPGVVLNTSSGAVSVAAGTPQGVYTIVYRICENLNPTNCDNATITVTVGVPLIVAVDDNAGPVNGISGASNVLNVFTNDELNGSPVVPAQVTLTVVTPDPSGALSLNPNGSIDVAASTPAGTYTLTYSICENLNPTNCDNAVVTVFIENNPPVAVDDINMTLMNVPVNGNVITNDYDIDGDNLSVNTTPVTAPTNGSVVLNTNGTYTYTPNTGYTGTDTFVYTLCDDGTPSLCDQALVTITISNPNAANEPPVANPDAYVTLINVPVPGNILDNDVDPDGDDLVINTTPITPPTNGTVSINPNGDIVYTPNPNFTGTDTFVYEVCDMGTPVLCDQTTVTITVVPDYTGPVNDPPFAGDDAVITSVNTPVTGNHLNNDFDPNGDNIVITTTPVSGPDNGTVVINPDGSFTYTPDTDYTGPDQFVYQICDDGTPSLCANATAYILVQPKTIDATASEICINDVPYIQYSISSTNFAATAPVTIQWFDLNDNLIATYTNQAVSGQVLWPGAVVDGFGNGLDWPGWVFANGAWSQTSDGFETLIPTAKVVFAINPTDTVLVNYPPQSPFCTARPPFAPVAVDDINSTLVNVPVGGNVLTNDYSPTGNALTANPTLLTSPVNGTVTLNPNGSYVYTPSTNFVGIDGFEYVMCDDNVPSLCDTAVAVITVSDPGLTNDPPVANPDFYVTLVNVPVPGNVLNNDSDPDGDNLILNTTPISAPSNGTVTVNANGTILYTPNTGFTGTDVFTYGICDDGVPSLCAQTTVTILVLPDENNTSNDPPFAGDDFAFTPKNEPVSGNLLPNDFDPNGDNIVLNTNPITQPANGTVVILPNGTFTYTPNTDYVGPDQFIYSICDDGTPSLCAEATAYITVYQYNNPPVAVDDINGTLVDVPVSGNVLTNDLDPDGDNLTVTTTPVTPPTNGTVTLNPDGSYTYTPTNGFTGTDTFVYSVCDDGVPQLCDQATVTITVTEPTISNDPPVANPDFYVTLVNVPVPGNILTNDSDPDGDNIILNTTPVSAPSNGSVTVNANGNIIYTPNTGFTGTDVFTYRICDDGTPSLCDETTVTVVVMPDYNGPDNDPPFAGDDFAFTPENEPVSGNLLPNDFDPNGDNIILNVTPLSGPTNGTVAISPDGSFTYTPNTDYTGPDQFIYRICDDGVPSLCAEATAYITVYPANNPPVAVDDINNTLVNVPVSGNVITNDYDIDGNSLTVNTTPVTSPVNGTVTLNANGTYTYTPNAGYTGEDTFTYQLCDDGNPVLCDEALVTITIVELTLDNDPPVANPDFYVTLMNVPVPGNITMNDADPDGDDIILNTTPLTLPANGTVTVNANGNIIYTPNTGFTGTDVFTYRICDDGVPSLCDETTVTIVVVPDYNGPDNDPPFAGDDAAFTPVNVPVSGNHFVNDFDPNGDNIVINTTPLSGPTNGTVVIQTNGTYTYTPNTGYVGPDQFVYRICDDGTPSLCAEATAYITVYDGPFLTWTITEPLCNGQSTGAINLTVNNATPPYTFIWSNSATTEDISGLAAGTYGVIVQDALGSVVQASIPLTQPAVLGVTTSVQDETIINGCNGTATANPTGGTAPYTYLWTPSGQTTQQATGLCAGIVQVTVTDANGCQVTTSNVINPPSCDLDVLVSGTNVSCNGGTNGTALATPITVQNNTPFTYLWSNGATTQSISGVISGPYSVTVTDAIGCQAAGTYVVTQPLALSLTTSTVDEQSFGACDGSVTVTPSGGTGVYTYSWTGGQTTQTATALCPGTYTVTVTDGNGCIAQRTVTINALSCTGFAVAINGTNLTCFGTNNGAATAVVTNGTAPFTYLWNTGATTSSISGLSAGTYTVTVTDAVNCSQTVDRVITRPALLQAATAVDNVTCFGFNNGAIELTVTGGTTPYTFAWSNGAVVEDLVALGPNTYNVTVTDANGCQVNSSGTVTEPAQLVATSVNTNVTCFGGSDGAINLTVTGGLAPYLYSWSGGPATEDRTGLAIGTYSVSIVDQNGCILPFSTTITQAPQFTPTITASGPTTFCQGGNVVLTATAGASYLWSNGATTQAITVSTTGTYTVTVTTAQGCVGTSAPTSVLVNPLPTPTATAIGPTTFCQGGSVQLTTGSFASYLWSTGATTQSITVSTAGSYTVTVTNANGCVGTSAPINVTVNPLPTPTITAGGPTTFCNGGSVQLTSSAASSYLWSTGATTQSITVSTAGNYSVTVTNANGCLATSAPITVTLNALPTPSVSANGPTTFCQGGGVLLTSSAASSYLWSNGQISQSIFVTVAGSYTVEVTDGNGCKATSAPVNVTVNPNPTPTVTPNGPTTFCAGGSVVLTSSPAASYLWNNGAITQSITVTTTGFYSVTVTNASGCTGVSAPVQVIVNTPPTATITPIGPTTFCQGGSVQLVASAGASYLWSNGATTQSITVSTTGSYSVQVFAASGCSTNSAPVNVTVNPLPTATITASGPTTICQGSTVTLTASAGVSYLWSNGATSQSITVGTAGSYTVTVTNANGCSRTSAPTSVLINSLPVPTITASGPLSFCPGGSVTLTASLSASYLWSNGATTRAITVTTAGSYSVQVTDDNGCTASAGPVNVTVNPIPTPTISSSGPTTFCQGGSVVLTASPAASYLWSTGATTASITVSAAGSYFVTVTNAQGCSGASTPISVVVNPNPTPTITAGGPTTFCQGGSVVLTASPAAGYLWSTGAVSQSITVSTSGSYSVTVTNVNGCPGTSAPVVVNVNTLPTPTVTANGPTTFCQGGSVTLMSSAAASYLWSTGATTQSITVSTANTYNVTVTDANGCSNTSALVTISVLPNPTPTITAGGPTTFCQGGNVVLTASPAVGYLWSTGATTQSITVSASGSYTVTVTDGNGCSGTSVPTTVTVNPLPTPTVTASGPTTFCQGGSVTLTASAGIAYLWSNGAITQSIVVSTTGFYSVTVTNVNGCAATSAPVPVNANPNPIPVVTAGGPTTFCQGGSVTLTSSFGLNYLWSTGATTQSITVSTNGNYTVTVTDGNGCTGTSLPVAVNINLLPQPVVDLDGPASFCQGDNVELTVSAGTAYLWNTGATTQSITVSTVGDYFATVTDINGCSGNSDTVSVTVFSLPTPSITADGPTTFCAGEDVVLTSSVASSYLWNTGATTQSITVSASGIFSVTVTDANGCSAAATPVVVTVTDGPTPNILPNGATTFCEGGSVLLTTRPADSYLWSNGATTQNIVVTTSGAYSVTVTDENGCSGTSAVVNVTVNPNPAPTIGLSGPATFCEGDDVVLAIVSPGTVLWSTGDVGPLLTVDNTGSYWATLTDANGCSGNSDTVQVTVLPNPTPIIVTDGTPSFCVGEPVNLTTGVYASYLWSNGATTQGISLMTSGNFTVTVTDANGCVGTSPQVVVGINPNPTPTISPDGQVEICAGETVTLTSAPAITYLWSTGETTQSIVVSTAGIYNVFAEDINGCTAISSDVIVVVNPLPTPTIVAGGPLDFCDGGSVLLSTQVYASYEWSTGSVASTITATGSGNYTVTVTDVNGCEGTSPAVTVTEFPVPVVTVTPSGPTDLCAGGSVELTANAASSYLWSTGETTQSIIVNTAGSYSVTITDANGCTATSAPVNVTIQQLPTPTVFPFGPQQICAGGSVTLTSTTAASYLWSTGETTQSIVVTTAGVYTLNVEDLNGCTSADVDIPVTVNPLPTPVIVANGPTEFCEGGSVLLSTSQPYNGYVWSTGTVNSNVVASNSGIFTVTVTDANGCIGTSAPLVVTEYPAPLVTISTSGPTDICAGGSVELTATAAVSYLWSTGETTQSITVDAAGSYTVTVTDANGCSTTATPVPVTILTLPTPTVFPFGPQQICVGGSVTLTSTTASSYLWSTGETTQSIEVTSGGIVSLTVQDLNGCTSATVDIPVTVNPLPVPVVVANGPTEFCDGGSVVLSTTVPFNGYVWSTGTVNSTITVGTSGTYSVTVTDANGCQGTSAGIAVTEYPVNPVTITSSGTPAICSGDSVELTASAAASYLWSTGATTPTIWVNASGNYTVVATDINGCTTTSAPMNVTILTNPTPTLFPFGPQFICDGQSITLTSTTAASYLWSTGATTQSIVVNTAGNYSVTVTDVNGCEGVTGSVPVTVNPLPVPTVIANGALEFCQGGNVLLSTQNFAGYQWSSGAAQQSTFVTQPGNYTVTVIDANGCVGVSAPINVTVNQPPTVTITADGPVELCQGGMVTLTATAGQNYSWSTGAVTQSITVFTSGTYIVSVTDANGCVGTSAPVTISVYPLPDPNIIASGPTEFCQGDSVQLTSSPAATYLWNTGATTQSIWVTQGGNYYVTLANGFGCEAFSSSINITINSGPVPVIAAGGPLQFCDGWTGDAYSQWRTDLSVVNGSDNSEHHGYRVWYVHCNWI